MSAGARARAAELRRNIDTATATGQAYSRLITAVTQAALEADPDDKIAAGVFGDELQRLIGLMDEMSESVDEWEHGVALLEQYGTRP